MSDPAESEDLLAAVLAEASPARFREALFGETMRLARRRRHFRQTRRMVGILAVAGLAAILAMYAWTQPRPATPPLAQAPPPAYNLVRTQSLPADSIVTTRRFSDDRPISSTVLLVTTKPGGYRELNDVELLALVSGRPAALVRTGPHSEELVFADPHDQKGFPAD